MGDFLKARNSTTKAEHVFLIPVGILVSDTDDLSILFLVSQKYSYIITKTVK